MVASEYASAPARPLSLSTFANDRINLRPGYGKIILFGDCSDPVTIRLII